MQVVGNRKERTDKKREVKPLIPVATKDAIHRISHITHKPVKDVVEFLTTQAVRDKQILDKLSNNFKRSIIVDKTYYIGKADSETIPKRLKVDTDIVSVKFKRNDYETISALAYALDCTPTRTTAILLDISSKDIKTVNKFVYTYMLDELTSTQMSELRKILTYINRHNDEYSSWLTVLSTIVGDIRPSTKQLYELVNDYLNGR